ncbi:MAG: LCP family protein [Anaerolineae bacterium]|nr:LCP family protein [Anaerolineae bacterium]
MKPYFPSRFVFLLLILAVLVGVFQFAWRRPSEARPVGQPTLVRLAAAPSATPLPIILTFTPIPTVTNTPTPGPSPTPTQTPTATPIPSATPTAVPILRPTLPHFEPYPGVVVSGTITTTLAIPTQVPPFAIPRNVVNILLMGKDATGVDHTDTIIIVSVNRDEKTAAMVSIPRDLYVYIPGKIMGRINTAVTLGGPPLLADTILYNLGIPIDYYAQVDFDGFIQIVDAVGGVNMAVSCGFTDHRLISPDLDPEDEESWELFTLEPGMHQMDGELALWYVRSRNSATGDDYGRGRRQQQLLRALFNKGLDLNLVPQVPTLYQTYRNTITTNMDIGAILQLAAIAPQVRQNGIQNLYLRDDVVTYTTPSGANVLLPNWETMQLTLNRLYQPPVLNQANRPPISVEIINASGNPQMALLAADNLAWYGFIPIISETSRPQQANSEIRYFAANFKGSYDWLISRVMNFPLAQIELVPDTPSQTQYQVILGSSFDPCVPQFFTGQ